MQSQLRQGHVVNSASGRDWREAFAALETCPWPGPRPLRIRDGEHLLCGRADDIETFLNEVDSHRVIFLTGSSGVGKTSLLRRGLLPELENRGKLVALCRDWSGAAEEKNPAAFLANRVAEALKNKLPDRPAGVSIMKDLSQRYGADAVLILDQFEELIRDARGFTTQLFDALVSLNKFSDIKIIISLRSEHLHELRPLEHRVQPFSVSSFYLDPVDDRFIPAVIRAGNVTARATRGIDALAPGAIDEIAGIWNGASEIERTLNSEPPGLLGLQALLYVLDERSGSEPVGVDTVREFAAEMGIDTEDSESCARLFGLALQEAAEAKLRRCGEASRVVGLDDYLIAGAMSILARSVPHLTSGGYKLVRNVWDLAGLALEDELATLRRGIPLSAETDGGAEDGPLASTQERAMFDVLMRSILEDDEGDAGAPEGDSEGVSGIDFLAASRIDLACAADKDVPDEALSWSRRQHAGVSPFVADPLEVTAGPLFGSAPASVLIEEFRRFTLALQWLRASYLVRISTPTAGLMMVALIHDGFGVSLERWARAQSSRPSGPLHGLTALGGQFAWPTVEGSFLEEFDGRDGDGEGHAKVYANLRWKGSIIAATSFRQVTFVNCDFRGALFINCNFQGILFLNCLLDGLMISDCTIEGAPSPRPERYAKGPTTYRVANSSAHAQLISRYLSTPVSDALLLADLPGLPASSAEDDAPEVIAGERGSLVIRGGRTASLSLRKLNFGDEAKFCVRDSAGSGFDVIEHTYRARYELTGCVLRHAAFTSPPFRTDDSERIDIEAYGSAIYQAWIGDDLNGTFTADDCTLIHIWNGSPADKFEAIVTGRSEYFGLIGMTPDTTCVALVPGEVRATVADLESGGNGGIVARSLLMDYRRDGEDDEAVIARRGGRT